MGSREEPLIREAKPQKPKAFCLPEVQMRHKFVHFSYPVNCSNLLFERILTHFSEWRATRSLGSGRLEPSSLTEVYLRVLKIRKFWVCHHS